MRPIYHRTVPRVEAHIFIASVAFLLDRALEKKLKSAGNDLSSKQGWQALKTVRVVDIHLGNGEHKQSVTQGSSRAAAILSALGIQGPGSGPGKNAAAGGLVTHRRARFLIFNELQPESANMG
jgi:transposase